MKNIQKQIVELQIKEALDDKGIAVKYSHWATSHTYEVALLTKTDYEKSYTLFEEIDKDWDLIPDCENVVGIDERNMLLFMF